MRKMWIVAVVIVLLLPSLVYGIRIKDIAHVYGVRSNQLIGYSLVVGLNGTGDNTDNAVFSLQSIVNMLERFGIKVDPADLRLKNVAAVMVTANLPPFAKVGSKLDAVVSSIGDAKSLMGGTLLMTPLRGPDGRVYAVAQGPISIGGFSFSGAGAAAKKNFPTVGRVVRGVTVEREIPLRFVEGGTITIALSNPDFTTASRIEEKINETCGRDLAEAVDPGSVKVTIPEEYRGKVVEFVSKLENLDVQPSRVAKVVVNERTGTVVIGADVRIAPVAVAQGGLSIVIKEAPKVSQPLPFSTGETVVTPNTTIEVKEKKTPLYLIPRNTTVGDLVRALNAIGATPQDLISILQAIKAAGALNAELEIL